MAVREIAAGHPDPESVDYFLGVLKSFALRATADKGMRERWQPGIDAPAVKGRADSGDIEIDLVELLVDAAGSPATWVSASPCSLTKCRTSTPTTSLQSAVRATN